MNIVKYIPKWGKKIYYEYKVTRLYDKAVEEAEKAHRAINERVYVIPDPNGLPSICSKKTFKEMKRKRIINDRMNMMDVHKICIYHTATRFGQEPMPSEVRILKRKEYIKWIVNKITA